MESTRSEVSTETALNYTFLIDEALVLYFETEKHILNKIILVPLVSAAAEDVK